MIVDDGVVYTPRTPIRTRCDVNMFLTRHQLVHSSVPRVPMSISHCWINTELEREKLLHNDLGFKETGEVPYPRETMVTLGHWAAITTR